MSIVHFLNVRQGDCSIIQHNSKRVTMIDVNCARKETVVEASQKSAATRGNFNQSAYPENPITYMRERDINSIFRFILTHPDMDHMDGIADIFDVFTPPNFWDTANTCNKDTDNWYGQYRKLDWNFYAQLRSESAPNTKRLVYHSGQPQMNFWKDDGLAVLAPSFELIGDANRMENWNDSSYVILYKTGDRRVIFAGDSHDKTWEHIIKVHRNLVSDVDLLVAPHHGRHSDRDFEFLSILNPKLTLFGNASSEHLAYNAWSYRGLPFITNNQAGSVVVELPSGVVYVTNDAFARKKEQGTFYNPMHQAWFWGYF